MTKTETKAQRFSAFVMMAALALPAAGAIEKGTSLDLSKSKGSIEFLAVGQPSAIKIKGEFRADSALAQGKLLVKTNKVSGKAIVELNRFDTGIDLRNQHMREKYLKTKDFPTAELEITELQLPDTAKEGDFSADGISFKGLLTLTGVKKPVSGTAQVKKIGNEMRLNLEFKFPLADHGIETPSYLGIKVTESVRVTVDIKGKLES